MIKYLPITIALVVVVGVVEGVAIVVVVGGGVSVWQSNSSSSQSDIPSHQAVSFIHTLDVGQSTVPLSHGLQMQEQLEVNSFLRPCNKNIH